MLSASNTNTPNSTSGTNKFSRPAPKVCGEILRLIAKRGIISDLMAS